jgi:crotonobetainyl-CoA:carnitine CoA-transferase CaiB-like acyl-CoA transferase
MGQAMSALEGIRVVDFSRFLPGPYCTWLLADMGADVIRIENPREIAKQAKVFSWDRLGVEERDALREADILARNKRSVMLDFGDGEAQAAIKALVATADIVVEDYRPGVLEGIGLGYEGLKEARPDIILTSLTLCGQTGPYRDKPGHDPIALAISGVMSRVGEAPATPRS